MVVGGTVAVSQWLSTKQLGYDTHRAGTVFAVLETAK